MLKPFHLSFVVPDKAAAKAFYLDVLGCSLGRETQNWFDILFFGHQLTIHEANDSLKAYTIDHFGPILSKSDWLKVSSRFAHCGCDFVMEPLVIDEGLQTETGKFLIADPSGNLLEFKYYADFKETVRENA